MRIELTEDQANSLRIVVRDKIRKFEARRAEILARPDTLIKLETDVEDIAIGYWTSILTALGDLPTY